MMKRLADRLRAFLTRSAFEGMSSDDVTTQSLPIPKPHASENEVFPANANAKFNVLEAELDKTLKENVRLRLLLDSKEKEHERYKTTKLQENNSFQEAITKEVVKEENQESIEPALPPLSIEQQPEPQPKKVSYGTINGGEGMSQRFQFHETDLYAHKDYKEEEFDGVIWRWHYKFQLNGTPRGITPYCSQCGLAQKVCVSLPLVTPLLDI